MATFWPAPAVSAVGSPYACLMRAGVNLDTDSNVRCSSSSRCKRARLRIRNDLDRKDERRMGSPLSKAGRADSLWSTDPVDYRSPTANTRTNPEKHRDPRRERRGSLRGLPDGAAIDACYSTCWI